MILKESIHNSELISCAEVNELFTGFISLSKAIVSNNVSLLALAHFGIEISHQKEQILTRCLVNFFLHLVVEHINNFISASVVVAYAWMMVMFIGDHCKQIDITRSLISLYFITVLNILRFRMKATPFRFWVLLPE